MKRIAVICELVGTFRQGGENLAMLNLAYSLKRSGFIVDIYSYLGKNNTIPIKSKIPLRFRLLPFIREIFILPFLGMSLIKKIEKKYDVIFASSTTLISLYKPKTKFIVICHLLRTQKIPNLIKISKYKLLFNPLIKYMLARLERTNLLNSSEIVVIRQSQKEFIIRNFGIATEKISVVPNGIDTVVFRPKKVTKKNQIIFVGRGTIPKGLDTILNAAKYIKANILIVSQKIDNQFSKRISSLANVRVKLNATHLELSKLYNESKIFILPSMNEEQPLSTLEAMACGLPVIVTKEAASDIVEDKVHGYIIPERNHKALYETVNELLSSPGIAAKMSITNRDRILKYYDKELNSEKITKLLNK